MTEPSITDAEAVTTLEEMAKMYGGAAQASPRMQARYHRYAAAIRWALSLTAFPVDTETPQ